MLTEGQRRELLPVVRGDAELLPLDPLIAGLGISVPNDVAGGAVTLSFAKREVSLYRGKSLASVDGDLRLLSSPAHLEDGRWLVPVDAVPRLLGPLLGRRADWRPTARVLIVSGKDSNIPARMQDTPEQFAERKNAFRGHRDVEIEECGHMMHHDQPQRLAGLLEDFLTAS